MSEGPPHLEPPSTGGLKWYYMPWVRRARRHVLRFLLLLACASAVYLAICTALVVAYRWIDPPTTMVQSQRRLEALFEDREYGKIYQPLSGSAISSHLFNAVVAAEDNRFFEHSGFDWEAIETAYREGGRRGGSTISQQLAKNLFLSTHRSYLRKAFEVPLTIMIELILPKERILELYVNIAEWGVGLFGVEAAAQEHFGVGAGQLDRRQAAALASCLPDPRRRTPRLRGWYTNVILRRMNQLGY